MPVYLAADYHRALQLKRTCEYWMGVELDEAMKNKQWSELPKTVQESVKTEHAKLVAKREQMKAERVLMQSMPCVFMQK